MHMCFVSKSELSKDLKISFNPSKSSIFLFVWKLGRTHCISKTEKIFLKYHFLERIHVGCSSLALVCTLGYLILTIDQS